MSAQVLNALVDRGLLDQNRADSARDAAERAKLPVGQILTDRGWVEDVGYAEVAAAVFGLPRLDMLTLVVDPSVTRSVDEDLARREGLVPLLGAPGGRETLVGTVEPDNVRGVDLVRFRLGTRLRLGMLSRGELERIVRHAYYGEPLERGPRSRPTSENSTPAGRPKARDEFAEELARVAQENRQAAHALRAIFDLCVQKGVISYDEFIARTREGGRD
ncbi:MAG: hypothetical protein AAFU79_23410 [Myxococcota bacterium]